MMRGTMYLERVDLRDPEGGPNPNFAKQVLTRDVNTEQEFREQVTQEYGSEQAEISFGPIGRPWSTQ